jgi:mono/diheme cytochrome c family protein
MTLRLIDRGLKIVSVVAAALFVVLLFAGPSLIGAKSSTPVGAYGAPASSSSSPSTSGSSASSASSAAPGGAAVFASAGCAGCHTLKAAHATGSIGPNLDQVHPSQSTVESIVNSGAGTMPSFSGKLTSAQISAVASYVASNAGK